MYVKTTPNARPTPASAPATAPWRAGSRRAGGRRGRRTRPVRRGLVAPHPEELLAMHRHGHDTDDAAAQPPAPTQQQEGARPQQVELLLDGQRPRVAEHRVGIAAQRLVVVGRSGSGRPSMRGPGRASAGAATEARSAAPAAKSLCIMGIASRRSLGPPGAASPKEDVRPPRIAPPRGILRPPPDPGKPLPTPCVMYSLHRGQRSDWWFYVAIL